MYWATATNKRCVRLQSSSRRTRFRPTTRCQNYCALIWSDSQWIKVKVKIKLWTYTHSRCVLVVRHVGDRIRIAKRANIGVNDDLSKYQIRHNSYNRSKRHTDSDSSSLTRATKHTRKNRSLSSHTSICFQILYVFKIKSYRPRVVYIPKDRFNGRKR